MTVDTHRKTHLPPATAATHTMQWQVILEQHLRGLAYGTVLLTVHDGKVVQIDCTHRIRLTSPRHSH